MRLHWTPIIVFAAWLIFPLAALGQVSPADLDEETIRSLAAIDNGGDHGLEDTQISSYSAYRFSPASTDTDVFPFFDGYRWLSAAGTGTVMMDVSAGTDVPIGALLGWICANVVDEDSAGSVTLTLWQYEQPTGSGGTSHQKQLGSADSTGRLWDNGYDLLCVTPIHAVTTYGDINSDGTSGAVSYALKASFSRTGPQLQFGTVRLLWQFMSRPTPATASFSDVPPDHWAFRHIEALVSSGIVAGCSGASYCPDEVVTRAQMAVVLANALGL